MVKIRVGEAPMHRDGKQLDGVIAMNAQPFTSNPNELSGDGKESIAALRKAWMQQKRGKHMLTAGQSVKDFTLQDKDGTSISLSHFKGKKVVVYFYPKDDTPGCTRQACAFRDAYAGFHERNITVIGISKDSISSHQKFAEKYHLPFLLLADPDGTVMSDFGVNSTIGAVRATFVINKLGVVEKVFPKASPDTNAADILAYLGKEDAINV